MPPGSADIFFPSDFAALAELYLDAAAAAAAGATAARAPRVRKSPVFLRRFGAEWLHLTETATGYNPMLEDFTNTSFLTIAEV